MRRLLSCLLLCLLPVFLHAAEAPRPKIGLVLSGGAARGLAHIGVLKALEEQGVKIDAIAGTSMGAVIGGLYASGYKIDELEKLALGIDWQQALSDAPPRADVPFRRKQDDRDFLVKQKLSFRDDGSLGLPLGVIQGQNLALLLESMLAHASDTRDFDKLPIPFRAVATDIASGEKVVFRKGHLPRVIRASMSIPAVFAPVELDGRLLVDGGMTDNIPLDVARDMGVDIAIVVDIGTPLRSRQQLATVVDVLNQSITLMTRRNSEEQLATLHKNDVLIQPPLASFGVTDFGRAREMIDAGYRATRILDARLASLRPAEPMNAELSAARAPGQRTPIITAIRVENDSKVSDDVIRYYIRQPIGEPLNLGRLQTDMGTLYGLDYFEQVQYRVVHKGNEHTLVINARGKRSGTDYLRLGLNLSDDMQGDSAFNLGASYRVNGINSLGAEWLTRVQIGDQQELYSEFYQPLDVGSRYFIAPYIGIESQNIEAVLDNDPIAEYRLQRYGFGLNIGRQIGNSGEIRFGVGEAWGKAKVRVGDQDLPSESFNEGYYELRYSFDSLDNVYFPHEGEDIGLSLRQFEPSLGSDKRYRQWEFKLDKALSSGPNTFILGGRYGRTLDEAEVVTSSFVLGGARQLSGFREDALSGQNISLMRGVYYRRLTPRAYLPLDFPLYIGGSLERGRAWNNDNEFDSGYINAASVFLGFDTPLGPLNFSYGINDDNQKAVYLNLGQTF
ncbi:bifunctional outer membrane translocase [Pseudomonas chlororaphis subsp. aurantiaca]|uniref:Patatin-like phospholipase family protein n=1 Tax=Pseudomonas chlororaphis subsp. aurantiaca TaxID=86192 RepID=A0AAJ1E1D4_9PSED|nr:patatin-like phospholipase family protein [Pseudomonas chlororaphis]AZD34343.1 bifunctional outer membrane translocase [Pseudomonas chlororaphis subsp. aurantiaca]AZD40678.1 bifunctional outer membrane translocase [Pseudomonas chlororaphis subsp. aurantiaca]AZD71953.1 bifunctional outer membrane translocase [Pseudomonas chlororaphis subsp. aurantiaca]AZD78159.1 bifunctional outer membrane translocase [Pseudomonas chlororaphis subsp. aurantiaca]MBU4632930.1 patatin-like phospholipase family 